MREVRNAARTADGMVHELPGGSSWSPGEAALSIAMHEVEEETGFRPRDLRRVGTRQLAATLLANATTLFAAELSPADLESIRAGLGEQRGVVADGERTYTELRTVREILTETLVDWPTVGMIYAALAPSFDQGRADAGSR